MDIAPGDAVCTRRDDGLIRVDRADPIIWISTELLESVDRMESFVIDGDMVSFGDINRVTYRITERHKDHVVAEKID